MREFNPNEVNKVIHSPIRLGIITILNSVKIEEVSFNYLKKRLNVTDGNLSTHLKKLEKVGYIKVKKTFYNKKPYTTYRITEKGKIAFREYLKNLKRVIKRQSS
ncbi:MAG: transcriptional regulator [candidate division WOR-3 bacterium]